jgi:hypothetical protein
MTETQAVERSVRVVNAAGLHARPAAQLVQTASRFVCEVQMGKAASFESAVRVKTRRRRRTKSSLSSRAVSGKADGVPDDGRTH